jgi:Domain of unknown function DUF11
MPGTFVSISATPSQGSCGVNGITVACALGPIAMGASATVQIRGTPRVAGNFNSQAIVASGQPDLTPANNTASVQTKVARCFGVNCP